MTSLQLEAFNGAWAILAGWCVVFMVDHLIATGARQHLAWPDWFTRMPEGMQLAVATLGICLAVGETRGSVWWWRWALGGEVDGFNEVNISLALGAFLGAWAFLCLLRVISRPRGRWPVIAAGASVLAYLATFFRYL